MNFHTRFLTGNGWDLPELAVWRGAELAYLWHLSIKIDSCKDEGADYFEVAVCLLKPQLNRQVNRL
jgi:hypothetical protein